MNVVKKARVDTIRANTAYPNYRGLIGIITAILMILAGLQALGAIIVGGSIGTLAHSGLVGFIAILIGVAIAVLAFFLAKIWNEAAQILVDIGDSVMDANPIASAMAAPTPTTAPTPVTPLTPMTAPTPPTP